MLITILITILLVTTAGCAKTYYVKPGATAADFDVDKEACVNNASMAAGGTYPPTQPNANRMVPGYGTYPPTQPNANAMLYQQDMVDQCLSQRGWRKSTPSETAEIERRQQQQQQ